VLLAHSVTGESCHCGWVVVDDDDGIASSK
jgi:hypothetical protein